MTFRMKRFFSLCEGTFNIPVQARTRTQKSACIRFWRNKQYFSVEKINGKKVLCFRGKEVLKKSEFDKVIESEFLHCEGVGSRKLKQRLATRYEGVSEPRVQGRVVRKLVDVNPGLKVNRRSNFASIEMLSAAYVLCSLRLFMLKTEGQKNINRTPC